MNIPPVVIIAILVAIGAGIYFYMQQQEKKEEETKAAAAAVVAKPVVAAKSEVTPAADDVIKVEGLVGWWDGPSYDETSRTWKDKSSVGNDITEITGLLKKSKNDEEVQGDTDSIVAFPENLMEDDEYTFISVAKYNGAAKGRIFTTATGSGENFLLGFHYNKAGVYHTPGGWRTQTVDRHGDKWVLSTTQPNLYRSNGALRTGFRREDVEGQVPTRLTINGRTGEKSDWAVKEMILYNRNLTPGEYLAIEKALADKYDIKPNRYEMTTLTGDTSEEGWPEIVGDTQFRCGKSEALTKFGVTTDKKPEYSCMSGIDLDGDEVQGKTIFEEIKGEAEYFKNLQNKKIDCGESPLNALTLTINEDEDKIQYVYTCNNSKVKKNSCQTVMSDAYDIGTSFDNISGLTNIACPADHVITSAKLIVDATDNTKQRWELTCCKPKGI